VLLSNTATHLLYYLGTNRPISRTVKPDAESSITSKATLRKMKSCLKPTKGSASPEGTTKSVEFGIISFREYPIIMGCNPSVGAGVPVTIGWKYFNEYDVAVETYERASNKLKASTAGGLCPKLDVAKRAKM
jgi:hypothetical protein